MKRKIILILFILNSLLLLVYLFPFLRDISQIFLNSEAASIGIIGGVDGPTAIFLSSKINWFPVGIISLEIILGISVIASVFKK